MELLLLKKIKMLEFALQNERGTENKEKLNLEPIQIPFFEKKLFTEEVRQYLKDLECSNVWSLISKTSNVVPEVLGIDKQIILARTDLKEESKPKIVEELKIVEIPKIKVEEKKVEEPKKNKRKKIRRIITR